MTLEFRLLGIFVWDLYLYNLQTLCVILLIIKLFSGKMLDLVTCAILSIITTISLIVLAIGSSYRLKKIRQQDLKIVLPKNVLENHQPIWAHRAFQNKTKSINPAVALEYDVDMVTSQKIEKCSNPDPICITIQK